jgi:hypothetical protein
MLIVMLRVNYAECFKFNCHDQCHYAECPDFTCNANCRYAPHCYANCHCAECIILIIVMLTSVMQTVVMLSVVAPLGQKMFPACLTTNEIY